MNDLDIALSSGDEIWDLLNCDELTGRDTAAWTDEAVRVARLRPDLDVDYGGVWFRIKVRGHKAMRGSGGFIDLDCREG